MSFFLIIIGIALIGLNVRFIKDGKGTVKTVGKKDKNSFTRVLQNEEIDLTAVDVIIGELRMEFSETILELQKEIVELTDKVEGIIETSVIEKENFEIPVDKNNMLMEASEIEKEPNNRMNEIGELLKEGFSVDEISEKYQIGRGEILLIKKLYQK